MGTAWPTPGRDAHNTAAAPATATPDPASLSTQWQFSPERELVEIVDIVADGTVYLTTRTPPGSSAGFVARLIAVDGETGERRWRRTIHEGDTPAMDVSSPFVGDERVFVSVTGTDTTVLALDPADGTMIWSQSDSESYGIATVAGGVVFTHNANGLAGREAATGERCWRYDLGGGLLEPDSGESTTGRPVVSGETVAVVVQGPSRSQQRLVGLDATDGTERWRGESVTKDPQPWHPVVADGLVFFAGETRVLGYDPASGEKQWERTVRDRTENVDQEIQAATQSTLVVDHSHAAGYATGTGTARWELPESVVPSAIGGEYLFGVASARESDTSAIVVYDLQTGERVAEQTVAVPHVGTVRPADGRLLVETNDPTESVPPVRREGILALA